MEIWNPNQGLERAKASFVLHARISTAISQQSILYLIRKLTKYIDVKKKNLDLDKETDAILKK
jgi:hypothetical protein